MNQFHFEAFKSSVQDNEQWAGSSPYRWWHNYVSKNIKTPLSVTQLDEEKLNRQRLKDICNVDSGFSDLECLISVMAWGG